MINNPPTPEVEQLLRPTVTKPKGEVKPDIF